MLQAFYNGKNKRMVPEIKHGKMRLEDYKKMSKFSVILETKRDVAPIFIVYNTTFQDMKTTMLTIVCYTK